MKRIGSKMNFDKESVNQIGIAGLIHDIGKSGYPHGIKGKEIPLESRIIAVADAYDAMTSERSYRKALCKDAATKELTRCSGTQFDPEIVDVFVNQVLSDNSDFGCLM